MNTCVFQPAIHSFNFEPDGHLIEDCFARLSQMPGVIFLDGSSASNGELNRYSYLAADPIDQLIVNKDASFEFAQVRRFWQKYSSSTHDLPPFQGGLAGYLSYELNTKLERISHAAIDEFLVPLAVLNIYDVVVAFDHLACCGWIISQGWPNTEFHSRKSRSQARLQHFRHALFETELVGRQERPNESIVSSIVYASH